MKKNFFLNFSLKYKFSYKLYLVYNLYIRNLKYLLKKKYSQCGEDIFLQNYFNKKKGFFIDIGCHHPFRYNNTFRLYNLGWKGINIDVVPDNITVMLRTALSETTGCTKHNCTSMASSGKGIFGYQQYAGTRSPIQYIQDIEFD